LPELSESPKLSGKRLRLESASPNRPAPQSFGELPGDAVHLVRQDAWRNATSFRPASALRKIAIWRRGNQPDSGFLPPTNGVGCVFIGT